MAGRIRHCGNIRISEFHQREGEEVSDHQLGGMGAQATPQTHLKVLSKSTQRQLGKMEAQWLVMGRILA